MTPLKIDVLTDDEQLPNMVNSALSALYPPDVTCWRVVWHEQDGDREYSLCFIHEGGSFAEYLTTGWFDTLEHAIAFFAELLKDDPMNLLKNDLLFPHIKGVMLKDKPVTLTLSGKVNVVQSQGNKARVEVFFSDHKKSAIISPAQSLIIVDLYGPDSEGWAGKRIELYGEFGNYFGKDQWGIRVSPKAPLAPRKAGKVDPGLPLDLPLDDDKPPFADDTTYTD